MKMHLVTTPAKEQRLLKALEKCETAIGFDTESVGGKRRYSKAVNDPFLNMQLSSMQGVSIAFPDEQAYYLPIRHRKQNCSLKTLHDACRLISLRQLEVWAHNVKHDSYVLRREGIECSSWSWRDSMLLWWLKSPEEQRGLKYLAKQYLGRDCPEYTQTIDRTGAEVMEYACYDALNALQLGLKMPLLGSKLESWFEDVETPFAVCLSEMEEHGIALNTEMLVKDLGAMVEKDLWALLTEWEASFPNISPTSSKQLQELFTEGTWEPVGCTSGGAFKTDKTAMEYQLKYANKAGQEAARLRLEIQAAAKVRETYVNGLVEESLQWPDRKLHPQWHHTGTATGRLSSSDPNLQNQLARGKYADLLKSCYVPDEGWIFTSADYSQIELRLFADMAGGDLLQAYIDNRDLHQEMADILGTTRQNGKTFNFGFFIYGGGPKKAAKTFGWDEQDAKKRLQAAAKRFPEAQQLRDRIISSVSQRTPVPYVKTRAGRIRYIPELAPEAWEARDPEAFQQAVKDIVKKYGMEDCTQQKVNRALRSRGERIAVNTIIQGSAADVAKRAVVDYWKVANPSMARVVALVHDEILTTCREQHVLENERVLRDCMEQAGRKLNIKVPLFAGPKSGYSWKAVHG
jgi:DNA polymerase-1